MNKPLQKANVFINKISAGLLSKYKDHYELKYYKEYLNNNHTPISLTLPLSTKTYQSTDLFPFFDGLLQEGWLKEVSIKTLHLDKNDKFNLLVKNGRDCVGNISLEEIKR